MQFNQLSYINESNKSCENEDWKIVRECFIQIIVSAKRYEYVKKSRAAKTSAEDTAK